jgi:hypothetical protein
VLPGEAVKFTILDSVNKSSRKANLFTAFDAEDAAILGLLERRFILMSASLSLFRKKRALFEEADDEHRTVVVAIQGCTQMAIFVNVKKKVVHCKYISGVWREGQIVEPM